MMRTRWIATAVIAVATLVVGCGPARRVPPIASPVALTSEKLVLGHHEFMEYCHQCHPHGESGLAPAINDKPLPTFLIRFQVRNGLGAMPAFSKEVIDDRELDAIVAYLRALRRNEG